MSDVTTSAALVAAGTDRYLTFVVADEVYALSILEVTEIMEYRSLTDVPMLPSFLRGVINLRGRVVPVVDLAARFGRGTTEVARRTSIVIVETGRPDQHGAPGGRTVGLLVDAVNKVVHFGPHDIEPPPDFGTSVDAQFISGMAQADDRFIIVLDATKVLSTDELASLEGLRPSAGPSAPALPAQSEAPTES